VKNIITLVKFDLKKYWSISRIITFMIFAIIINFFVLVPNYFNFPVTEIKINMLTIMQGLLSFFVPVSVLFFTGAIIFSDKRSFYLRTILTRPISRDEYLFSKYLFSLINLLIATLFFAIFPTILSFIIYNDNGESGFFQYFFTYLFYIIEGLLFISISITLSFVVNSYLNIFMLAIWIFLENTLINGVLANFVSYSKSLAIITDFFFPSGFSDAAKLIGNVGVLFWESLLWGLTALAFFFTLSIYLNSKTKIDTISE